MSTTTRRQFLRRSGVLAAAGVVSPAAMQRALAGTADASFVFRNGVILTFDARDVPATCVAVRDDLIIYVGTDAGRGRPDRAGDRGHQPQGPDR